MATKYSGIRGVTQPIPIKEMVKRLLFGARLHSQALAALHNIPLYSLITVAKLSNNGNVVFGPSEVDESLHHKLEEYLEKNPEAIKADFSFDYKIFDLRHDPPLEVDKRMPEGAVNTIPLEAFKHSHVSRVK